jgi:TolA-binding protein
MARIAWITVLITLISFTVGCRLDTAGSQLVPPSTTTVYGSPNPIDTSNLSEADLAEQVALTRQEYLQAVQLIVDYYGRMGDSRNLEMARRELSNLKKVPMYDYLGGVIPGPELRARVVSAEADTLYKEAMDIYNKATKLVVWKQKGQLTLSADKLKQLIRNYPSSDKIDDAAFYLGVIFESFKDYQLAFNYYERSFQWDERNPHPSRFKAAFILDKYLNEKDQALDLYQAALVSEGTRHPSWKEHAEKRIPQLRGTSD